MADNINHNSKNINKNKGVRDLLLFVCLWGEMEEGGKQL
jgi:hypothetical protein